MERQIFAPPDRRQSDFSTMAKRKRADENVGSDHPSEQQQQNGHDTLQKDSKAFEIPVEGKSPIPCERHGNRDSKASLIFTHGAGGGLNAPAMQDFADGFVAPSDIEGKTGGEEDENSSLVMFKGNMSLKSRISSFHRIIEHENCTPAPALGGRSMGARAAGLAAQQASIPISALVLVSFPLIGAAKSDSRAQILLDLPVGIDVLFITGGEDTMCPLDELVRVTGEMKARTWIVEVEGADHGMALQGQGKGEGSRALRFRTGEIARRWLGAREVEKRVMEVRWGGEEEGVVSQGWVEEGQLPEGEEDEGDEGMAGERTSAG